MIATYNQDKFISQAIASAIGQDYDNLEIVVTDDGSTDGTPQLIMEWARQYPGRIVPVLNETNDGITKNCNAGLSRCTGDFVAFMGGDDILLPPKITKQVDWFATRPNAVLCGHLVDVILDGVVTPALPAYMNFGCGSGPVAFISHGMQLHGASLMVRSLAIPEFGFDESIPMASDLMFCIDLLSNGGSYGFVDEVLIHYRIHRDNISKKTDRTSKDLELTFHAAAKRYPQYKRLCESSITRHVHYFGGVKRLASGDAKAARTWLWKAIRRDVFFAKAWVRLVQAYLPKR